MEQETCHSTAKTLIDEKVTSIHAVINAQWHAKVAFHIVLELSSEFFEEVREHSQNGRYRLVVRKVIYLNMFDAKPG